MKKNHIPNPLVDLFLAIITISVLAVAFYIYFSNKENKDEKELSEMIHYHSEYFNTVIVYDGYITIKTN